jgi:hypothetical protein
VVRRRRRGEKKAEQERASKGSWSPGEHGRCKKAPLLSPAPSERRGAVLPNLSPSTSTGESPPQCGTFAAALMYRQDKTLKKDADYLVSRVIFFA